MLLGLRTLSCVEIFPISQFSCSASTGVEIHVLGLDFHCDCEGEEVSHSPVCIDHLYSCVALHSNSHYPMHSKAELWLGKHIHITQLQAPLFHYTTLTNVPCDYLTSTLSISWPYLPNHIYVVAGNHPLFLRSLNLICTACLGHHCVGYTLPRLSHLPILCSNLLCELCLALHGC